MDKLTKYSQLVKEILTEYSQYKPANDQLEIQTIFDEELVKLGVEKQDIVIGFHPPLMRKLTDYAVG